MSTPLAAVRAALRQPLAGAVRVRRHCRPGAHCMAAAGGDAAGDGGAAVWADVLSATERAARLGAVYSIDTGTQLLKDERSGVEFVVRVAKALRDKPKAAPPATDGAPKPPPANPFLPYDEALFVRNVAPHHALLLNKFNVVPHHLLLVTRAFQHQTEQLSPADFEALLTTLRAFPTPGGLAFMNIGDASGFSQPHKHVQLVPLPFSQELPHAPVPIGPLVERAAAEARRRAGAGADPLRFDVRALPFRNACVTLSNDATPEQLAGTYDEVLSSLALKAPAASFNLLMTSAWLMLIPRSAEHGNGVAVNALGFAGTMLVRSTDDLERVRADPMAILADAGAPW